LPIANQDVEANLKVFKATRSREDLPRDPTTVDSELLRLGDDAENSRFEMSIRRLPNCLYVKLRNGSRSGAPPK
jgi:hypothetical protein